MTNSTTSKFVAAAVGFALALTVFVGVGAATASAQSMTLSQLVDLFISLGIISADKAAAAKAAVATSATTASAYTFAKDLTVGSSGADVTALQKAVGVTPATGFFGSITKAAVQKYQTANGINATGFVGALTRAALNKTAASTTTTTTTTTTTGASTVINSGVEGTLTADKASISNSTIYEGDTMHTVLGIKLQARLSDINVQRVRLNLGADTTIYTKAFKTAYLTDDSGRVLGQADLNSNTVVKDGSSYILTFGGFNYTVAKDATKYLWVKFDAYSSFKTSGTGNCAKTGSACVINLAADGVRGTDGAGIDQYGGGTAGFSQTLTLQGSLIDSASLDLSVNAANFKTADVVASNGTNNDELDKLPVLMFDLRANKDDVDITDVTVNVANGTDALTPTLYLYDGSTLIQTESASATGTATFADISNYTVSKDSTRTLTLKADVRGATTTPVTYTASVVAVRAENSQGTTVTGSGTPSGEAMVVRSVGPVFTLLSKSIAVSGANQAGSTSATSTITATFAVRVTAVGGDIYFANQASTTQKMFAFALYNSAGTDVTASIATSSTGFAIPTSGVTNDVTNGFKLAKGASVDVTGITVDVVGRSDATGNPIITKERWTETRCGRL